VPLTTSRPSAASFIRASLSFPAIPWQALAFALLAIAEIVAAHKLFAIPQLRDVWWNPAYLANQAALLACTMALAFPVLAWQRRAPFVETWRRAIQGRAIVVPAVANLALLALLIFTRFKLATYSSGVIPETWLWIYAVLLLSTGAALAAIVAPASFWVRTAREALPELALAFAVAALVLLAQAFSREGWSTMSGGTLVVSHWLLSVFEGGAFMDMQERILGVGDFRVQIWAPCSGYEGIALILAFLAVFFWIFRGFLRFPNALVLVPIGLAAVWLLNAARIAALVSIGAHVSPEVAVGGFHTWSGWIAFLIVSMAIMVGARHSAFVWVNGTTSAARAKTDVRDREVPALLAPFIASIGATIFASAFAPYDQWLYVLKVVSIGSVVWWYRDVYVELWGGLFDRLSLSALPLLSGFVVGAVWIATEPERASNLGPWLAGLPAAVVAVWLVFRAVGSVVLVPVAEELAFRGYLYRVIAAAGVPNLTPGQLRLLGLIVSSVAFGALHDRWLAAALAGAVYAALLWRSGRISDAIVAHMISNGVIIVWSIAFAQWNLL
jgi:exosortase E/protease (VPEID-CTERM system)